jgi:hypothetical protein
MSLFDAARVKVVPGHCAGQRTELVEPVSRRSHWTVYRCSEPGAKCLIRYITPLPRCLPNTTHSGSTGAER